MTISTKSSSSLIHMSLKTLTQHYVNLKNLHDFEGDYSTKIDNVRFYHSEKGHQRKPIMYKSGLIILGQGNKALYLGGERIPYGARGSLVMGISMRVEYETYPNSDESLLGMSIKIPIHTLQKQVARIKKSILTSRSIKLKINDSLLVN